MTDSKTKGPHTAITTWSGFIYQGKVAMLHVLKLLVENPLENIDSVLQLDSLEDFSILNNGRAVSLHQVKARKDHNYSAYQEALEKLRVKARGQGCRDAYFHLATEITDKTPEEIHQAHNPVKLYVCNGNSFCELDGINGIDQSIEIMIQRWMVTFRPSEKEMHLGAYVKLARNYLDELITKQVLKIHQIVHDGLMSDRQAAFTETIGFSEFLSILQESDLTHRGQGENYYFYIILKDINRYYQEYYIENGDSFTVAEHKKLSWCMLQIENTNQVNMVKFIQNIIPHRKFKFDTLIDYKDNGPIKDEIHDAFFKMIRELKPSEYNIFFQWIVGQKSFVPTAIIHGTSHKTKICERIIKNALDADLNIMFERNNLITTDLDISSITDEVPGVLESDEPTKDQITKWKTVSLISLDNAKGEINV